MWSGGGCHPAARRRRARTVGRGAVRAVRSTEGAAALAPSCAQAVGDILDVVVSLRARQRRLPGRARRARAGRNTTAPEGRRVVVRAVMEDPLWSPRPGDWLRGWCRPPCDGVVCATGLGPEARDSCRDGACRAPSCQPESVVKAQGSIGAAAPTAARAGSGCGSARCRRSRPRPAGRVHGGRPRPAAPSCRRVGSGRERCWAACLLPRAGADRRRGAHFFIHAHLLRARRGRGRGGLAVPSASRAGPSVHGAARSCSWVMTRRPLINWTGRHRKAKSLEDIWGESAVVTLTIDNRAHTGPVRVAWRPDHAHPERRRSADPARHRRPASSRSPGVTVRVVPSETGVNIPRDSAVEHPAREYQ